MHLNTFFTKGKNYGDKKMSILSIFCQNYLKKMANKMCKSQQNATYCNVYLGYKLQIEPIFEIGKKDTLFSIYQFHKPPSLPQIIMLYAFVNLRSNSRYYCNKKNATTFHIVSNLLITKARKFCIFTQKATCCNEYFIYYFQIACIFEHAVLSKKGVNYRFRRFSFLLVNIYKLKKNLHRDPLKVYVKITVNGDRKMSILSIFSYCVKITLLYLPKNNCPFLCKKLPVVLYFWSTISKSSTFCEILCWKTVTFSIYHFKKSQSSPLNVL